MSGTAVEQQRAYRDRCRAAGRCIRCRCPAEPGKALCAMHQVMLREAKRRSQARLSHACPRCGEVAVLGVLCRRCAIRLMWRARAALNGFMAEVELPPWEVDIELEAIDGAPWRFNAEVGAWG